MATKNVKKPAILKSFRLLDFNIYDETTEKEHSDSEGSDNGNKKQYSSKFVIQMFGVNESGETYCLYVNDFNPFFFIKVGDNWNQGNANLLLSEIKRKVGVYYEDSIVSAKIVDYHKLYGFSAGKKYKFVQIVFKNTTAMNKVKNFWYDYSEEHRKFKNYEYQGVALELYESSIPPLLRYFHIHNISPSGWIAIPLNKVSKCPIKTTTCNYEYICLSANVRPLNEKETRVPYKICSFDIEASSSHGDFPLPKKTYKRLASNMVDIFNLQFQSQNIDNARSQTLCKKMIMTAFGYENFDDIDLVYPKFVPSKERLSKLIQSFIETPINDAKKMTTNTDDAYTIESLFEQMKEANEYSGGGAGGDDSDDDGNEVEETPSYYKNKQFKKKSKKVQRENTIIDILISDEYIRDEKIQYVNEMFRCLSFPALEGDKVTFIGSTFMRYGEPEPYFNHCLVLGSCDDINGITVQSVANEKELLLEWTRLIQKENPDIIIGYNIFGFDYEFMFRRAEENHCEEDFLMLSRKIGDLCAKRNKDTCQLSIENTKIQLATGEYDLRYFKMAGRLQVDMYTYFRRDFNLPSYKLDDVAGQFISDDVKRIECVVDPVFGEITELYSQNLAGLHIDDFIHIELTSFTSDYYKDGKKFKVIDIVKNREVTEMVKGVEKTNKYNVIRIDGHHEIDRSKSIKWGMAKDDVTPQDIFRLANGSSADRAIVAKYCIQDCNLVHHLMNKIDVITGYVEMSRICSVPISFLIFRGQGIKLTSYVAKKCREKDTLMPDLEKSGGGDGYEGAIVLPPKCSMYMDNPVACVDYSSLYPSSMISQNLSHDSKVWTREYDLRGNLLRETGEKDKNGNYIYDNLPGYEYINLEFDTYKYISPKEGARAIKTKCGKMICRWAQFPDNKKGIMPSILEELLYARASTRKLIKTEKDPFMQNILDKRQLGYKVTANSLYGQCGARTSTFYEKDVAASTTATGRMMIIYAKRIIEEVYGDMVYETAMHGPVKCNAEYVYGDSVANYTPVYVKDHRGRIDICTIEELAEKYGKGLWVTCREEGKQEKEFCELSVYGVETWTDKGWTRLYRVIRHVLAPHKKMIRIYTGQGLVDVTDDHSLLDTFANPITPNDVSVGTPLLHNPLKDICIDNPYIRNESIYIYHCQDVITAAKYINYLNSKNRFDYHITSGEDNSVIVTLDMLKKSSTNIKKMQEIPYEGFVYDLTTENHHFAAGVGNMIVHNTDSVFFTFNLQNPETGENIRGKPALEMTIEIAQDAAQLCTQWLKPPMELSYEKTLMPFILLSKKRYVGMLYEEDANKGKLKYMGLSLKRRDSCDYLKDTYGGILNILMKENNIKPAIDFLEKSLNDLIKGNVAMDKLMITKALRSDYKNPQQIAHRVLADRIGQRDPGNKPKPGDRMRFVHVVNDTKKALQGEKIETPEFIVANDLKIDYIFYITNQLMKPLQQLLGLALEQIWAYQNKHGMIKTFKKDMVQMEKEYDNLEVLMKKREKYCSAKIKVLLFDKVLNKINNDKHNIQEITNFFTQKK
uniref:DNA-directed DNA polymerase n=1 Tax=viral metagenome TaxID=1070528 RepID=A0A6C0EX49_9ZZZZ